MPQAICRSEHPEEGDPDYADQDARQQGSSPDDRRYDQYGSERLCAVREAAFRKNDRRSDERSDDRDRQSFEVARCDRGWPYRKRYDERQRAREERGDRRAEDREPDHRRAKTAISGATNPAVMTALFSAPSRASAPEMAAAEMATTTWAGLRTA